MDICEAVYGYLKTLPSVSDIVSDRIYPLLLPQKCTLPAVAYNKISINRTPALQADSDFCVQNVQLSCYAKSYAEVVHTANAIRNALKNYVGQMLDVFVQAVLTEFETENYDSATETYVYILELQFYFND